LHYAAIGKNTDIIIKLLRANADVGIRDNKGNTALYVALYSQHVENSNILLDAGADINNKNNEGDTPLHYTVKDRSYTMVKFLLEKGANVNITNNKGQNPLDLAKEQNFIEIIDILNNYIPDVKFAGWNPVRFH
jgi:ankyrin repeat protein